MGRLLRGPDDHPAVVADPSADPAVVDPAAPVDPAAVEPAKVEPPKIEEPVVAEPLTVEKLSAPEGFEVDAEQAKPFLEILNDSEMSSEDRANALIALHTKTLTEASEASSKGWEDMQTQWRDEVKADPEVGGDKMQPALDSIGKLVDEFGDDELKDVFSMTGAGNNVHVIKFLNKIAGKLTEGNFFSGGSPSADSSPDAAAKRMFPSMKG